jgi:hypothetical protein
MQDYRFFISNERKILNEKIDDLSSTWSAAVIEKKRKALNDEFDNLAKSIEKSVRNDITTLVRAKKEAFADMLATPPTTDQLNLISALRMRGDSVSTLELTLIMPSLFGNYQAMANLQALGVQSGNNITLPVQLDCRTMFENLNNAEEYLLKVGEYVAASENDLPIQYHAFYTVNPEEKESHFDPTYNEFVELLDTVPQLNEVEISKTSLSDSESSIVNYLFKEVANLNPEDSGEDLKILKHTQKVMTEHPDTIEMLKLSKYKDYVAEVEKANKK